MNGRIVRDTFADLPLLDSTGEGTIAYVKEFGLEYIFDKINNEWVPYRDYTIVLSGDTKSVSAPNEAKVLEVNTGTFFVKYEGNWYPQ